VGPDFVIPASPAVRDHVQHLDAGVKQASKELEGPDGQTVAIEASYLCTFHYFSDYNSDF
jgi:hypothetical protein